MLTITHRCGHNQAVRFDELYDRLVSNGKRLIENREQFLKEQINFLERNMCPTCYCKAKEINPNLKPN